MDVNYIPVIDKDLDAITDVTSIVSDLTNLKQTVYVITYFANINSASGQVAIPANATVQLNSPTLGGLSAVVSTISGGVLTGITPTDSGGNPITVSSFDSSGNYTLSGTPSSYPVALIYVITIQAQYISGLTTANIIDQVQSSVMIGASPSFNGKSGYVPQPLIGDQTKVLSGAGTWVVQSGSGITTLNGLTTAVQTFATIGTTGLAPSWTSSVSTHTLNIPLASAAGVTAGLISKTDYDSFAAKGNGTVTSVAWTTSQGVSATIATSTTTPNITIALGALTGVTSFNGLVITANTGVITTGTLGSGAVIADVTMTLGSDATGDTYYRNSGGVLTRIPIGTRGQIKQVGASSIPVWNSNILDSNGNILLGLTTVGSATNYISVSNNISAAPSFSVNANTGTNVAGVGTTLNLGIGTGTGSVSSSIFTVTAPQAVASGATAQTVKNIMQVANVGAGTSVWGTLWLCTDGNQGAISATNYTLSTNGNNTNLRAVSGNISFVIGSTVYCSLTSGLLNVGVKLALVTGTTTIAPLAFTSGTNLTTAVAGSMEYNGTNLFFTRTGTTREAVLVGLGTGAAPSTSAGIAITNYYGSSATNFLGTPVGWFSIVDETGATRKVPYY